MDAVEEYLVAHCQQILCLPRSAVVDGRTHNPSANPQTAHQLEKTRITESLNEV